MGGLGNQMFAYAFALALRRLGREVALDVTWHDRNRAHNGWELDRIFGLSIPICSLADRDRLGDLGDGFAQRLRRRLVGPRRGHVKERGTGYDPRYLGATGDAYFDGFWQSYRYHEGIERQIEAAFRFPPDLEREGHERLEGAGGRTTIGVHVRRGDYLESDALGGVCGEAYYGRAIGALAAGAVEPLVFFFSDDLDWCRDRLGRERDAVYVDWNRGSDSWRDMRLMTRCDRLAISNSSFGWWGARLGENPDRMIVAPSRWYGGKHPDNTEIVLPAWMRVAAGGQA